ncbi:hypothetical protein CU097_014760 [Rhizopus azygosporus]|uniref:Uncharacterized protein n=1 Tax=Rhizopus azygosporus TaxID=86630 RepID=A0A367K3K3_RHIAZ|nr:hypothetical protein CU097_014760 [Rhizopus azygosporus]
MPAENYRVASSEWFNNTRNDIHRINKSLTGVLDVIKAESDLGFPERLSVGIKRPPQSLN